MKLDKCLHFVLVFIAYKLITGPVIRYVTPNIIEKNIIPAANLFTGTRTQVFRIFNLCSSNLPAETILVLAPFLYRVLFPTHRNHPGHSVLRTISWILEGFTFHRLRHSSYRPQISQKSLFYFIRMFSTQHRRGGGQVSYDGMSEKSKITRIVCEFHLLESQ